MRKQNNPKIVFNSSLREFTPVIISVVTNITPGAPQSASPPKVNSTDLLTQAQTKGLYPSVQQFPGDLFPPDNLVLFFLRKAHAKPLFIEIFRPIEFYQQFFPIRGYRSGSHGEP
jgi:hypothetical protein